MEFGYVLPYVSRVFKEAEGRGILDYVNKLRIEDVKKQLCTTNKSLQEIADHVGFSSAATLIRVFKKYETMTPNNYKKSLYGDDKKK